MSSADCCLLTFEVWTSHDWHRPLVGFRGLEVSDFGNQKSTISNRYSAFRNVVGVTAAELNVEC
jgi:hypothetical protein